MYNSHISLIISIHNLCTPFKYINNVSHLIARDISPLVQETPVCDDFILY